MLSSVENNAYLAFLRYCLDSDNVDMPEDAKSIDWRMMLSWAERQSIVGPIFDGIKKTEKQLGIPTNILFDWIGYANMIESQNRLLSKRCVELTENLAQNGFESCILKGQGNATLYDVRCQKEDGRCMALLRTPGDIDSWVIHGSRFMVKG